MYHIFHGNHRLILAEQHDKFKKYEPDFVLKNPKINQLKTALQLTKKATKGTTIVFVGESNSLLKKIIKKFKLIIAAGGLVFNDDKELLFIKRNGKWDLPKGKIESGEDIETCAIREVFEETGTKGLIIEHSLSDTFHTYYRNKEWVIKQTHWFKMSCDQAQDFVPQIEEGIEEVKWMSIKKKHLATLKTYPAIEYIIESYSKKK